MDIVDFCSQKHAEAAACEVESIDGDHVAVPRLAVLVNHLQPQIFGMETFH